MTEQISTDTRESLSQKASRRLRGALAENRISQTDMARLLHMPQQKVSRKVNGQTPMTLDEIEMVADIFDVPVDAILGVGEFTDRPIGRLSLLPGGERRTAGGGTMFLPPAEAGQVLCAIRDSNPEPADKSLHAAPQSTRRPALSIVGSSAGPVEAPSHHPDRPLLQLVKSA